MSEDTGLTPERFYEAMRNVMETPAPPPSPVFVGDDFEFAKFAMERGAHILCSQRVRTLLGEHMPTE